MEKEALSNRSTMLLLDIGMDKQEVLKIMGAPDKNESYRAFKGVPMVVWFYRVGRVNSLGVLELDKMTPLVFTNGTLEGWGDQFYTNKAIFELRYR